MSYKDKSKVTPGDFSSCPDIMNVYDAATFLGVGINKVYLYLRQDNGIPHQRLGRDYAIGKTAFGKYFGII
jgi:hypothetical protein